jgi:hypothetical protein
VSILVTGPDRVSQEPVMGGVSLEVSGKTNVAPSQTSVGTIGKNVGIGESKTVTANGGGVGEQLILGVN